jgi:hypothetical protein
MMSCTAVLLQVPVHFGPAKHRSTQIDNEKILQGTSDTPLELSSLPGACKPRASLSPTAAHACSSAKPRRLLQSARPATGGADAAELDPASWTIYQTDFAATAAAASTSTNILTHSPARFAAARTILEGSSEWAEINKLEQLRQQQEVRDRVLLFVMHDDVSLPRAGLLSPA